MSPAITRQSALITSRPSPVACHAQKKHNDSEFAMPARDIYHDAVKRALVKDGWSITHDPMRLPWGRKDLYVDLGAEKLLAADIDKVAALLCSKKATWVTGKAICAGGEASLMSTDVAPEIQPDW